MDSTVTVTACISPPFTESVETPDFDVSYSIRLHNIGYIRPAPCLMLLLSDVPAEEMFLAVFALS